MITISETPKKMQTGYEFSFYGMSTDVKPTLRYKKKTIANGSSFFEIDTKELKMYDQDTNAWK